MRALPKRALLVAASVSALFSAPARAVDADPGDYTPLKPGTNLFAFYAQYTHRGAYDLSGQGLAGKGNNLDSSVAILRYVHYMMIGPFEIDPQIIVPVGSLYNARSGGQALKASTGVGDIIPFATLWLVNKPGVAHGTYLGISPIVSIPTGHYDHTKALNFGTNRFSYDAQVGLVQGLSRQFTLYVFGDLVWYGGNHKVGPDRSTLRQSMTGELQTWLRYTLPGGKTWLSLGHAGYWGGKQEVDGTFNGTRTDHQQVRLAAQTMLTDSIELEGLAGRDLAVRDGFRENLRLQLRLCKLF